MDILSKLPLAKQDSVDDVEPEMTEEEMKKERIAFHRRSVRNGPTKFSTTTAGQIRRMKVRALARDTKKARKRQVRAYLKDQREGATVRAHLQAAGVLPYFSDEHRASPEQIVKSLSWIISRFAEAEDGAEIEVTHDVVVGALQAALNRWQAIVGYPATPLSPAYTLPVALSS